MFSWEQFGECISHQDWRMDKSHRKWSPAYHEGGNQKVDLDQPLAFKDGAEIYPHGYSSGFVLLQDWNVLDFHISSASWPVQSLLEVSHAGGTGCLTPSLPPPRRATTERITCLHAWCTYPQPPPARLHSPHFLLTVCQWPGLNTLSLCTGRPRRVRP